MKETNELLSGESTDSRPSKSGVAGSSPAGPTKNKGVSDDPLAPPTSAGEGRELLNVGKTLEDTAAQIAHVRELSEEIRDSYQRCLRFAAQADEEGKVGSADAYRMTARVWADRLAALTAAADALEREAGLVEDSKRLTWIIQESNVNGRWLAKHVWDDATSLCPVDYDEANDVQKWVRAAIDAARGVK